MEHFALPRFNPFVFPDRAQKREYLACRSLKMLNEVILDLVWDKVAHVFLSSRSPISALTFRIYAPRFPAPPRPKGYLTFPIKSEANDSLKGPTIGSNSDKETILTERPILSACFLKTPSALEFSVSISCSAH